ncbi:MAG: YihY/virulence factor BrkB family protein, partial [Planctomycetes bacterium]|nr:YihY/virulence factor BrkB family protein [Planctomycetota bacterium]
MHATATSGRNLHQPTVKAAPARRRWWLLLKGVAVGWHDARVSRLAASLSFYTLLSLVPLLVITDALLGLALDRTAVRHEIDLQLTSMIGGDQARALRAMLDHAQAPAFSSWQTVFSAVMTFIGAAGVFLELKDSLNSLWRVKAKEHVRLRDFLRGYFAPMTMVLGFGFLLLVSFICEAALAAGVSALSSWQPGLAAAVAAGDQITSWLLAFLLFAATYRFLPDTAIAWREVWLGAAVSALLFVVGRWAIGLYLGTSDFAGRYGPAGAILAIVVWIYYSAQIFLSGALFTRLHAESRGRRVEAAEKAPTARVALEA